MVFISRMLPIVRGHFPGLPHPHPVRPSSRKASPSQGLDYSALPHCLHTGTGSHPLFRLMGVFHFLGLPLEQKAIIVFRGFIYSKEKTVWF